MSKAEVLGRSKAAGGSAAAAKPEATTTRPTNAASDIQVFDKSLFSQNYPLLHFTSYNIPSLVNVLNQKISAN